MDCSLPGSSVHGTFQARILEWVAISSSRGSSPPRDPTRISCIGRQILYHWVTWEALLIGTLFQNEVFAFRFPVHWKFSSQMRARFCQRLVSFGRRQWQPTPVFLPEKSLGRRSLVCCSPWGREESNTTEWLHFHFSLSCTGEWNGNPHQCSCLENPGDGGAWWAATYGVAQSRTRLKWLSSSSIFWNNHVGFVLHYFNKMLLH